MTGRHAPNTREEKKCTGYTHTHTQRKNPLRLPDARRITETRRHALRRSTRFYRVDSIAASLPGQLVTQLPSPPPPVRPFFHMLSHQINNAVAHKTGAHRERHENFPGAPRRRRRRQRTPPGSHQRYIWMRIFVMDRVNGPSTRHTSNPAAGERAGPCVTALHLNYSIDADAGDVCLFQKVAPFFFLYPHRQIEP